MKEVAEGGIMESTTLLSKQTKVSIISEKEQETEMEEVEVLTEKSYCLLTSDTFSNWHFISRW